MHFLRQMSQSQVMRILFRHSSSAPKRIPIVKVLSTEQDESVAVIFQYITSKYLTIREPKTQSLQNVLARIKLMAAFQHKKEEIRQSVYSKLSNSSPPSEPEIKTIEKDIDVRLIQNNVPLDVNTPNIEAWDQASVLKIGDTFYEVCYNIPTVTDLSLPNVILSGCVIRPHFMLENVCLNDSTFVWYRSITDQEATKLINDGRTDDVLVEGEKFWLKIATGFVYFTSTDDVNHFLKVVCTPRQNNKTGHHCSAESKNVVEPAPELFPFEERQAYTKSFCDDSCVRCVSYNVLAKMYVDVKKFPYASQKARDNCYRKQVLLKELAGYNSDIICLQEVQERMFEYDLVPVLNELGYTGFYTRKSGQRYEGLATFYRSAKFKATRSYGIILNQVIKQRHIYMDLLTKVAGNYKDMSKLLAQHTAFQVLLLENVNLPGNNLLVANTHLYSNKDTPEVRLIQAAICTYYIDYIIKQKNLNSIPILFCGDFNSVPDSETFDFMVSGNYKCSPSWQKNSDTSVDTALQHNLCLDSACGIPPYTNYTEEFHGCLDYIFYSKNILKVKEVVPMPRHEQVIAQVGLPNELFPSDHIPLVCTLEWNKS